jgi:ABC-type branched-subunit amino acid transport system ATPase component
MKERSETRVDSSHVCKLVLIAASEKAFESAFSNRPLGFKRVSVGKIADFSFPGVFRPLFRELTETVKRKSAARGLAAIAPEGRRLFLDQSVENNLILGALHLRRDRRRVQDLLASVYNLFPVLLEYRRRRSSFLSGGEQQMVAIGGILMSDPKILLLDESSDALAPVAVETVVKALLELRNRGASLLLVEQRIDAALRICVGLYIMTHGEIVEEMSPHAVERKGVGIINKYLG